MAALAGSEEFHAGTAVQTAHALLRERIAFMHRDRAMDGEVRAICELQQQRAFAAAAHPWLVADVVDYP
jgi:histidine ammonia-lyase